MKKFFNSVVIAALCLLTLSARATTLTGTVKNPDKSSFNGAIYFTLSSTTTISSITLPSGYVCPGPVYVPNTYKVGIQVVNGALQGSVDLYDSECTQPKGLVYDVQLVSSTGKIVNQQWMITGTTEDIGSIVPVTQNNVVFNVPLLSGGSPGPTGPAGPNTVNSSTTTSINGPLAGNGSAVQAETHAQLLTLLGYTPLNAASNLSDLGSAVTARASLGLGSAAILNGPSGAIVGTTDTQTISNKTFATVNSSGAIYNPLFDLSVYQGGILFPGSGTSGNQSGTAWNATNGSGETDFWDSYYIGVIGSAQPAYNFYGNTNSGYVLLGSVLRNGGYSAPGPISAASLTAASLNGLTTPVPVSEGGTGTTTPGIVAGSNIVVSGTWPNQTISSTGGTATAGGYTPVITVTNTDDTNSYAKPVCVLPSCNPGGSDTPASSSQTVGTVSSPPSSDTQGTTLSLTTTTTSTQTNALWANVYGVCNDCTQLVNDFWFKTDGNIAAANAYEADMAIFDKTRGYNFTFGLQCHKGGYWQIANNTSPWVNTVVACSLATNTWYHVHFVAHRIIGDTSCSGSMPCQYFDSLAINGVTTQLNQTLPAIALISTWSGAIIDQKQIDISSTSSAQTVTEIINGNSLIASTGTGSTGTTDGSGSIGDLASYNFDGTGALTGLTTYGSAALSTTNVYSSPDSVHFSSGSSAYSAPFAAHTTIYTRQYVQVNTVGSTTDEILDLYNGSTELYTLYLSAANILSYYNETISAGGATSAAALPIGSYVYVEMYWTAGTSTGAVTIKLNGTTVYTGTGLNTGTLGATTVKFGQPNATTGWDTNIDNLDVSSTNWLGAVTLGSSSSINPASGIATWGHGTSAPTGSCQTGSIYSNTSGSSGSTFYVCVSSAWIDAK